MNRAISDMNLSMIGFIDSVCDQFETGWKESGFVNLEEFVQDALNNSAPLSEDVRQTLITELIRLDLFFRWRALTLPSKSDSDPSLLSQTKALPQRQLLEDYLALLEASGHAECPPLDLVVEEYRARHMSGERPAVEEYLQRFPSHQQELPQSLAELAWELEADQAMLEILVYREEQLAHSIRSPGPVELGRQARDEAGPFHYRRIEHGWRLVIATLKEDSISRKHVTVHLTRDAQLWVQNLSSKRSIRFQDGQKLPSGEGIELPPPQLLSLGSVAVRIRCPD